MSLFTPSPYGRRRRLAASAPELPEEGESAPPVAPATSEAESDPDSARSTVLGVGLLVATLLALIPGLVAAGLVLTSDPDPYRIRLFIALASSASTGLATLAILLFGARTASPLADVLRAFRRGALAGIAVAGLIVLQLNQALSPANIAFLLLVLLIFEMVFLARRQNPAP